MRLKMWRGASDAAFGSNRVWMAGIVAIQLLCLYAVGREALLSGLPLDDAWIHQVIARNFAEAGELGFAPGHFGSAATSLLWPAVLSLAFLAGAGDATLFSLAVNASLYLLVGVMVFRLTSASVPCRLDAALMTAAFVIPGNFVWFAFSGMEAMLLVFLVCATVFFWEQSRADNGYWMPAVLSVALLFTRTEAAFFPVAIVLYELLSGGSRQRVLRYCMAFGAGLALLLLLNFCQTGHILPPTLEGRRWMWFFYLEGVPYIKIMALFPFRWLDRLGAFTLGDGAVLMTWAACGLSLFGVFQLWCRGHSGVRLLIVFGFGHLVIYGCLLPIDGHGGRYQPMTPSLFSIGACFGVLVVAQSLSAMLVRWRLVFSRLGKAGVVYLLVIMMETTWAWGGFHADAVKHIETTEVAMGKYLATLPEAHKVASFDIGGIGFFSHREILDLGALSDPSVLNVLRTGMVYERLQRDAIAYVVLPQGYNESIPSPWNYLQILGLERFAMNGQLIQQYQRQSHPYIWASGLRATLHGSPTQVLYVLCPGGACKK